MNRTNTWIGPAAICVTEKLAPLQAACTSVIASADQFLQKRKGMVIDVGKKLRTMDVRNLYPSIDRAHMMAVLAPRIRQFWAEKPSFATFLLQMIELLLSSVYVVFRSNTLECNNGVPTGLSAGVMLANIYLASFDEFVVTRLGASLQSYDRLIDDVCMIDGESDVFVLDLFNSWHTTMQFDATGTEPVNFLDLTLSCGTSRILAYTLFRKPQNLYLHMPANSTHHPSTKHGMLKAKCSAS